jgi:hypothetical protein
MQARLHHTHVCKRPPGSARRRRALETSDTRVEQKNSSGSRSSRSRSSGRTCAVAPPLLQAHMTDSPWLGSALTHTT